MNASLPTARKLRSENRPSRMRPETPSKLHCPRSSADNVGRYPSETKSVAMGCGNRLSREQMDELKEIFSRFDLDADGSLTQLELGALLRSLGMKPSGEQLDALLRGVDANNNGLIEFAELVGLVAPEMTNQVSRNQEQLLELFRAFDRDGNGYITAAELAHSMAKLGHALSFRELTEMIEEADTDGDGRISFAEFAAVMTSASADYLHKL